MNINEYKICPLCGNTNIRQCDIKNCKCLGKAKRCKDHHFNAKPTDK